MEAQERYPEWWDLSLNRKNDNIGAGTACVQISVQEASNIVSEKEPRECQEEYLCFVFVTHPEVKCPTMQSHQFLKRT